MNMKSYSEMTIQEKIAYDYGGTQLIDDVNHAVRRFFRCWLDGSYLGEAHYRTNCAFLQVNRDKPKRLRSFVIEQFCAYTAYDYGCSMGYAQQSIAKAVDDLETLNALLIEDALDLIENEEE
jgi:hypothetical protein